MCFDAWLRMKSCPVVAAHAAGLAAAPRSELESLRVEPFLAHGQHVIGIERLDVRSHVVDPVLKRVVAASTPRLVHQIPPEDVRRRRIRHARERVVPRQNRAHVPFEQIPTAFTREKRAIGVLRLRVLRRALAHDFRRRVPVVAEGQEQIQSVLRRLRERPIQSSKHVLAMRLAHAHPRRHRGVHRKRPRANRRHPALSRELENVPRRGASASVSVVEPEARAREFPRELDERVKIHPGDVSGFAPDRERPVRRRAHERGRFASRKI